MRSYVVDLSLVLDLDLGTLYLYCEYLQSGFGSDCSIAGKIVGTVGTLSTVHPRWDSSLPPQSSRLGDEKKHDLMDGEHRYAKC